MLDARHGIRAILGETFAALGVDGPVQRYLAVRDLHVDFACVNVIFLRQTVINIFRNAIVGPGIAARALAAMAASISIVAIPLNAR